MEQKINFNDGGMAVVMCGNTGLVKEFLTHPRVKFIECLKVKGDELEALVPNNTKAVIMTDGLPQYHQTWIFAYCQRKKVVYLVRKSNQHIYDTLKSFFPANGDKDVTQEEAQQTREHGKLNQLVQYIDFTKSNSENGHNLMRRANELHIKTTIGSVTQLVANHRRRQSGGTVPRSARPKLDVSVEMLDGMIKELTDMREFLIATVEENRLLRDKVERFKKVLE